MKYAIWTKRLVALAYSSMLLGVFVPAEAAPLRTLDIQSVGQGHFPLKFESPEHNTLGTSVLLRTPNGQVSGGQQVVKSLQTKSGVVNLTFADMIWLSGDFMGEPKQVIGLSSDPAAALQKNLAGYNKYKEYLPAIKQVFADMLRDTQANIQAGQALEVPDDYNYRYNAATGGWGGALGAVLKSGLYLKMAAYNYDHFGDNAIKTYVAAHSMALDLASKANNASELNQAYFVEGYADHFLTDLFAAGHLRTPRAEVVQYCSNLPQGLSSFLTKLMHDQDGTTGLNIVNGRGETWFGAGDNHYYTEANRSNRERAVAALQKSVDQVYAAYQTKNPNVSENINDMLLDMPDPASTLALKQNQNTYPPLYIKETTPNGALVIKFYNDKTKSYSNLKCGASSITAIWNYVFK